MTLADENVLLRLHITRLARELRAHELATLQTAWFHAQVSRASRRSLLSHLPLRAFQ